MKKYTVNICFNNMKHGDGTSVVDETHRTNDYMNFINRLLKKKGDFFLYEYHFEVIDNKTLEIIY